MFGSGQRTPVTQLCFFFITAELWVTDSDAYPLIYKFGHLDESGKFQLWKSQSNGEYTVLASPGYGDNNHLTVRVCVEDSFGSTKCLDETVTVAPAVTVNEGQVNGLVSGQVETAENTGDYSAAIPSLSNILATVTAANNTDGNLATT